MISYADLEKAYRGERASPILQKIPGGFYADARKLAVSPDIGEYKDMVAEILEKLYYQRINKIIHYAGRATPETKPPENMVAEEAELYAAIVVAVVENKALVLDKPLEVEEEVRKPTLKVRMKQALPTIVGSDLREYGPFREDDVVELPEDSARLLIERDAAEKA
jgi:DNA replication initiation complex subunit (GINS family)